MNMNKECTACLDEMQKRSHEVHSNIVEKVDFALKSVNNNAELKLSAMEDKVTVFLANQEQKADKAADKLTGMIKWWIGISLSFTMLLAGGFAYFAISVEKKADKDKTLSIEDAKIIRELGDKYYDARYIHSDGSAVDESNYKLMLETLFHQASRGGIKIESNQLNNK